MAFFTIYIFLGRKASDYGDNETKGSALHTETFPDFIVEWFSPNQVYLYSENKPSKIVRSVTTRLGFHKCKWLINNLIYDSSNK